MAVKSDIERYRTNYLDEQDGSELYQSLAKTERDPHLAELYRRMAETEQRHASIWADYLRKAGEPVPTYTTGWPNVLVSTRYCQWSRPWKAVPAMTTIHNQKLVQQACRKTSVRTNAFFAL